MLRAAGISKRFGTVTALAGVDLEVRRGEIHALLGGNGSGKSTLIKILAGVYKARRGGSIEIGGQRWPTESFNPHHAKAAGLHFVHQSLGVFPDLSVSENLSIGRGYEAGASVGIRWRRVAERARRLVERYHLNAAPETPLRQLRLADQSIVAIARALQDQEEESSGILVLDEPTAALPRAEVEALFETLRRYAAAGQTIVFVSHRLDEVRSLADRVSVLRDGRLVATRAVAETTHDDLIEMMFSRFVDCRPRGTAIEGRPVAVDVRHLSGGPLKDVNLQVGVGEVVGIAGLVGSGRTELLHSICGVMPCEGEVILEGQPAKFSSPRQAIRAGVALVPENRAADSAFPMLDLRENLIGGAVGDFWRGLRLSHKEERAEAERLIHHYDIRPRVAEQTFATLSGGNQQKAIMARWLRSSPRLLLLDEPTQGVDVGARAGIHDVIRRAAADGAAVLVVSSDLEELVEVCDRAVVLSDGRIVAEATGSQLSADSLAGHCYESKVAP